MGNCHCWAFYKDPLVYEGTKWQDFSIQLFDPIWFNRLSPDYSALFFLVSWSRIDKSETQYKQQMGQSLVFVSVSPIAIEGEETKQDPQTHLSFFYYIID